MLERITMAKNSQQVRVALAGSVFFVPTPITALPVDLSTIPAGAVDLGWTTPDGVTFTLGREVQGIDGWQTSDMLRQIVLSEPKSMAFTLRQLARDQWAATMGGTFATVGTAPDDFVRWTPANGELVEGSIIIDFTDVDLTYRFGFPLAQQTAEVQFALVRNDAVNLPNTWSAIKPAEGLPTMFMDTDDPAFAA